jgi:hypothetical protein
MPPLGPSSFHPLGWRRPRACRPRRDRRCLLKDCERPFVPSHPQARYCSEDCRRAARNWRRWQASQRYRATPHGQERRRAQQRRYRQRCRQLTHRRRARASAQRWTPRIFRRGRVSDPVAMKFLSSRRCYRPNVSVRRCAGWRYGACWIAKRGIGSGGDAGDVNVRTGAVRRRTPPRQGALPLDIPVDSRCKTQRTSSG